MYPTNLDARLEYFKKQILSEFGSDCSFLTVLRESNGSVHYMAHGCPVVKLGLTELAKHVNVLGAQKLAESGDEL